MNYRIQFQTRAIYEYEDATKWYSDRSQQAADNFSLAVEEKINILRKEPERFRKIYKEFREVGLKKYPYKIVYTIKEKEKIVAVASIFHEKRNPKTKFKNLL